MTMASLHINLLAILLFLTLLLPFSTSSTHPEFLQCFQSQLENTDYSQDPIVYTPNNASFQSLLLAFNLRPFLVSPRKPLLIITPTHLMQIQAAITCSQRTGLRLTVRSGGHDYEGLSYTAEVPFVIIDLRKLNSVKVNMEEKTAWVEGGATIGELYYALQKESRTLGFSAGSGTSVGVGGHISGGGVGMMSRMYGLASDLVIDAKLIDAQGRILDRRSMGEDLFWAIRGGGGTSFGIIVAFKVKLVDVPETVTLFDVTRTLEQNATQLFYKWQTVANEIDERVLITMRMKRTASQTLPGTDKLATRFMAQFLGSTTEFLPILQDSFPELGISEQDCKEMSWIESVLFFGDIEGQPMEQLFNKSPYGNLYFKAKSDFVREPIPIEGVTGLLRFLLDRPDMIFEMQLLPFGGVMNTYSESETPFPHRAGTLYVLTNELNVFPNEVGKLEQQLQLQRELYDYMTPYVSKSPRAAYINYRDLDLGTNGEGITSYERASAWGMKYFKGNFDRLVRVKTKFDPTNFFRNEQSIPPLPSLDEDIAYAR